MKSQISNYIVFDVETTGLSPEKHAIIEIACCAFDNDSFRDLEDYESGILSIYDNREITEGALNANGISRKQIQEGKDPKVAIDELVKYLKKIKGSGVKPVLIAQNGDRFDIPFLDNMFSVFGKNLADYVNTDFTIDTMWWARIKWTESTDYKLRTLCQNAGVQLINAHRAVADTKATKELVKIFLKSLRNGFSTIEKSIENTVVQQPVKRERKKFEF